MGRGAHSFGRPPFSSYLVFHPLFLLLIFTSGSVFSYSHSSALRSSFFFFFFLLPLPPPFNLLFKRGCVEEEEADEKGDTHSHTTLLYTVRTHSQWIVQKQERRKASEIKGRF